MKKTPDSPIPRNAPYSKAVRWLTRTNCYTWHGAFIVFCRLWKVFGKLGLMARLVAVLRQMRKRELR